MTDDLKSTVKEMLDHVHNQILSERERIQSELSNAAKAMLIASLDVDPDYEGFVSVYHGIVVGGTEDEDAYVGIGNPFDPKDLGTDYAEAAQEAIDHNLLVESPTTGIENARVFTLSVIGRPIAVALKARLRAGDS